MDLLQENAPLSFPAALERIERVIAELARVRRASINVAIAVDAPKFDGAPLRYRVDLKNGKGQVFVYVDHDALIDSDECFTALTVPQLDAAIRRLKRVVRQLAETRPS
jgi:hypothetical protein